MFVVIRKEIEYGQLAPAHDAGKTTERCMGIFPNFKAASREIAVYLFDELDYFASGNDGNVNVGGFSSWKTNREDDVSALKVGMANMEYEFKAYFVDDEEKGGADMTAREGLLTAILDCGTADLSLLDDVQYDWEDIFERLEDYAHDLNSVMREVFQAGYENIQVAVDNRICELEAIEMNERDLDNDEADELALLRDLNASEDFDSYHNYLDTSVWCRNHADAYKKYMAKALEEFEEDTGFYISLQ